MVVKIQVEALWFVTLYSVAVYKVWQR